jgi:nucleoside-diphosphate-sugar epimerase
VHLQDGSSSIELSERLVQPGTDELVQRPDASYGWTKFFGELLAENAREAGTPVTVVRPFSGYGEDQGLKFPFMSLVSRVFDGDNPVRVWGSGTQVRDWIHIDDVIGALMVLIEGGVSRTVNLGTGVGRSMRDVIYTAGTLLDRDETRVLAQFHQPAGVAYRVADTTELNTFYTPKITLNQGVERALAYLDARRVKSSS